MGFFATFWSWLNTQLAGYVGSNTAVLANALQPTVVVLATLYVMIWGYLQMTGRIDEPIAVGIRRIVLLAVVLGVALRLWLYNTVIVDTFFTAPSQLAAAVVGTANPVSSIDAIWQQGGSVAEQLWDKGGVLSGDFGFYLAGAMVWLLIGALCVYTMFLIALSSIACAVLLAFGPLFIVLLLFDATRRYFEAWIAQLANYALITMLTVLVAALLLQVVSSYATQTAARGSALLTVDALDLMLMAMLVLLLMRQIMPIAAGLAGGIALSSFGLISRGMSWGARRALSGAGTAASLVAGALAQAAVTQGASEEGSARPGTMRLAEHVPSWRDSL
ncbi:MAG TPA: type IV secretion system protein [Steroidobacteraceae bacterium]|jgi:type IV secretion system protein VirB6|nr:type IV secretion system protein [Steroidobacteraceae bacterium]